MRVMKTMTAMACVAVLGGLAIAKDKKDDKKKAPAQDPMAAAMAKYATPGAQHKSLTSMVGSWSVAGKFWQDPSKPPMETTGTAEYKAMGDLWVTEDFKGEFMGKPFFGHGVDGYDLTKNKYVSTWVDTMGSYIMNSEGTADPSGKVITATANDFDPMTGKNGTVKMVTKIDSDKQHTMSMWKAGPDGKEVKLMELVYTKK
jgi:hypothetical protein